MEGPPAKRRRLSTDDADVNVDDAIGGRSARDLINRIPKSLSRAISPPKRKNKAATTVATAAAAAAPRRALIPSPFRLTTIRDLPQESNADAVSLGDLVGDPLIAECWDFNYLHDVDFLMSHLDEDTRSFTKVHIVHGFWKREDPNKIFLEQQAAQYDNVELHAAFMPEMFGTHHSKMLILLRRDDTAQVIIHTANMIAKDWTNLTNGVWQSPPLPLSSTSTSAPTSAAQDRESDSDEGGDTPRIGSGARFKADLLAYLRAYNAKRNVCRSLVAELQRYDFSGVRGALVASVPGKHDVQDEPAATRWGWAAVRHALRAVPITTTTSSSSSSSSSSVHTKAGKGEGRKSTRRGAEIVAQISSIATLGASDTWLRRTLFEALSTSSTTKPEFKVVFPTPDEIRRSLDGYASGGSIHMRIQSAQQQKQLQYMRPLLCHWANDSERGVLQEGPHATAHGDGGRNRAAPHIKTYIRYSERGGEDEDGRSIDWALLTSANISKQAWGEAANGTGQIRIASWEIGVLVWPELLASGGDGGSGDDGNHAKKKAKMVATFQTDMPRENDLGGGGDGPPLVGLRIPYSLPLRRYADDEVPWVATADYSEPDWKGRTWEDP
ncbi:hypothetical protein SLS62_003974 [Diatrype stigma]|uniref:Tyrosyl-DNA phosphodiesterase n=1 Tax=Diatrype stigma TaxID=117547 RepID=A0AAN9YPM0_9PEZI